MKSYYLLFLLVLLPTTPKIFGETLDYSVIFVNSVDDQCSDRNYKSLQFYETITEQYLTKYDISHNLVNSMCITMNELQSNTQKIESSDLPIIILDSNSALNYLFTTNALGHWQYTGLTGKDQIVFGSFSPFTESDTGAWTLSHELSHFALHYMGYPESVFGNWVHQMQDKANSCIKENLSLNQCPDLWTTVNAPSGKDVKMMAIYSEYKSQKDYSNKNPVKTQPTQNIYANTKYDSSNFWKCRDYINSEQYSQAISCYEHIIDDIPYGSSDYTSMLSDLARSYEKVGDYESAISKYKELLDLNPNDFYSIVGLCYAYYDAGNYEDAVKYGKQAIDMKPNDAGATICYDYSKSNLEKTTSEIPSTPNASETIFYGITNGKVIGIAADTNDKSLLISIQTNGDGVLSITLPRTVIDARNGDDGRSGVDNDFFVLVDGSEVDFEETTTSSVRTLTIQFEDGTSEIEIIGTKVSPKFKIQNVGDLTPEAHILSNSDIKGSDNEDELDNLLTRGDRMLDQEKFWDAIYYYDKALLIDPENTQALVNKGFALDSLEKHEEALTYYDKALLIDPSDVDALNNKGYALENLGKYKDALFYYEKALEIDPGYTLARENKEALTAKLTSDKSKQGGGCLIATATYGTELAPQVQLLREVRDNVLFGTGSGTAFMTRFNEFYYSFSPTIADWERQNPVFKEVVKISLMPMLSTLSILNYVDIDSEQAMLGYGIGVILLNVGVYMLFPILLVTSVRRHL
jgi:tetratricopeptide (TPR) repeat protein